MTRFILAVAAALMVAGCGQSFAKAPDCREADRWVISGIGIDTALNPLEVNAYTYADLKLAVACRPWLKQALVKPMADEKLTFIELDALKDEFLARQEKVSALHQREEAASLRRSLTRSEGKP